MEIPCYLFATKLRLTGNVDCFFARKVLKTDKIPLLTAAHRPLNDMPTRPVAVSGVQRLVTPTIMPFFPC